MKKILYFGSVLLAAISLSLPLFSIPAMAAPADCTPVESSSDDVPNSGVDVEHCNDPALKGGSCSDINNCSLIKTYVQPFFDFLAALIGVLVVIAIVHGGIQYASSGGDPQSAAAAKKRITNALVALLTFFFFYAFLRFVLLPGGLD